MNSDFDFEQELNDYNSEQAMLAADKPKSSKKKISGIALAAMIGIFAITLVAAAWYVNYQGSSTMTITSEDPLSFSSDFMLEGELLDTTNSSLTVSKTLDIYNSNGNITGILSLTTNQTDFDDGCTIEENETILNAYYIGGEHGMSDPLEVSDGGIITINPGSSMIELNTTFVQHSCPQNYTFDISITPN